MTDNRGAIRPDFDTDESRLHYIEHRLTKRESTPGVSWSTDDHLDIRWLISLVRYHAERVETLEMCRMEKV